MIQFADKDDDGKLSPEEFVKSVGKCFDQSVDTKFKVVSVTGKGFDEYAESLGLAPEDAKGLSSLFASISAGFCGDKVLVCILL